MLHPLQERVVHVHRVKQLPHAAVVQVEAGFVRLGRLDLQEDRVGFHLLQFQAGRFGADVVQAHPEHTLPRGALRALFALPPLHAAQLADLLQRVVGDQRVLHRVPTLHDAVFQPTTQVVHANVVRTERERQLPFVRVRLHRGAQRGVVLVQQRLDVLHVRAADREFEVELARVRVQLAVVVLVRRVVNDVVRIWREVQALEHVVAQQLHARKRRFDDRRRAVAPVRPASTRVALVAFGTRNTGQTTWTLFAFVTHHAGGTHAPTLATFAAVAFGTALALSAAQHGFLRFAELFERHRVALLATQPTIATQQLALHVGQVVECEALACVTPYAPCATLTTLAALTTLAFEQRPLFARQVVKGHWLANGSR